MSENRLLYSECISVYEIQESFIDSLNESGLIRVILQNEDRFVECDDLSDLEQFIRWYYDMNINVEGIEALHHMLGRMKMLQQEMNELRNELNFYKSI